MLAVLLPLAFFTAILGVLVWAVRLWRGRTRRSEVGAPYQGVPALLGLLLFGFAITLVGPDGDADDALMPVVAVLLGTSVLLILGGVALMLWSPAWFHPPWRRDELVQAGRIAPRPGEVVRRPGTFEVAPVDERGTATPLPQPFPDADSALAVARAELARGRARLVEVRQVRGLGDTALVAVLDADDDAPAPPST